MTNSTASTMLGLPTVEQTEELSGGGSNAFPFEVQTHRFGRCVLIPNN